MAGGGDEARVGEGGKIGERAGESAEVGAGVDECRARLESGALSSGEDFAATTGRRGLSSWVWLALVRSETGRPPRR